MKIKKKNHENQPGTTKSHETTFFLLTGLTTDTYRGCNHRPGEVGFKQASGDTQPATSDCQSIPRTGTSYSCLKVLLAFFLPTGQATVTEDATIEKEKSDLNKLWVIRNQQPTAAF